MGSLYRIVSRHRYAGRVLATCLVALVAATSSAEARERDRTLKLYYVHTGERGEFTYKRNGKFDAAELKKINQFLRDWRRNEPTKMDPRLFDIIWEVYREVGGRDYIHVLSGYRSPKTNDMLRRRSRGVAKNSLHTRGQAMDFYIPGVSLSEIRKAGLRLQNGGVGFYPRSGSPFVHLDTGSVRHWPRMTRQQLAAVFPKGGTLHIPSDGKPLPGYELAKSKLKRQGATAVAYLDPQSRSIRPGPAATTGDGKSKATVAKWLKRTFDGGADEEEDNNLDKMTPAPASEPTLVAENTEPAPLPRDLPEPARQIALASLDPDAAGRDLTQPDGTPMMMASAEAAERSTLEERLAPAVPTIQTQDQIRLARLMAQAALKAETEAVPSKARPVLVASAASPAVSAAPEAPEAKPAPATFTVASAEVPTPSKKPEVRAIEKTAPATAGSAIDMAFSVASGSEHNKTITVKTENTLALAYAGLGASQGEPARQAPVANALGDRRKGTAPKAAQIARKPAVTTVQSDEIIDGEVPITPVTPRRSVDFARFLGGETTRTIAFAGLEMPHPFAVPGFFDAPETVSVATRYHSAEPLRFDRFAAAEQPARPSKSRLAAVTVSPERFSPLF